jgi:hypothetical protein
LFAAATKAECTGYLRVDCDVVDACLVCPCCVLSCPRCVPSSLPSWRRFNPASGEAVRKGTLEELVEVVEGSEQARFLTTE